MLGNQTSSERDIEPTEYTSSFCLCRSYLSPRIDLHSPCCAGKQQDRHQSCIKDEVRHRSRGARAAADAISRQKGTRGRARVRKYTPDDISATGPRTASSSARDAGRDSALRRPSNGGVAVRRRLPLPPIPTLELRLRMLSPADDPAGLSRIVGSACTAAMSCTPSTSNMKDRLITCPCSHDVLSALTVTFVHACNVWKLGT